MKRPVWSGERGRERWKGLDSVKENNTLCVDVFIKPITKYSDFEPLTNELIVFGGRVEPSGSTLQGLRVQCPWPKLNK